MNFPARRGRTQHRRRAAIAALSLVLVAGNILYAGCASAEGPILRGMDRTISRAFLRASKPDPESEWNASKLWVQVASGPALYVPSAYGRRLPPAGAQGEWFEDSRDKKRLFVPKGGAGGLSEGVLRGEAIKITCSNRDRALPQHYPN